MACLIVLHIKLFQFDWFFYTGATRDDLSFQAEHILTLKPRLCIIKWTAKELAIFVEVTHFNFLVNLITLDPLPICRHTAASQGFVICDSMRIAHL